MHICVFVLHFNGLIILSKIILAFKSKHKIVEFIYLFVFFTALYIVYTYLVDYIIYLHTVHKMYTNISCKNNIYKSAFINI